MRTLVTTFFTFGLSLCSSAFQTALANTSDSDGVKQDLSPRFVNVQKLKNHALEGLSKAVGGAPLSDVKLYFQDGAFGLDEEVVSEAAAFVLTASISGDEVVKEKNFSIAYRIQLDGQERQVCAGVSPEMIGYASNSAIGMFKSGASEVEIDAFAKRISTSGAEVNVLSTLGIFTASANSVHGFIQLLTMLKGEDIVENTDLDQEAYLYPFIFGKPTLILDNNSVLDVISLLDATLDLREQKYFRDDITLPADVLK